MGGWQETLPIPENLRALPAGIRATMLPTAPRALPHSSAAAWTPVSETLAHNVADHVTTRLQAGFIFRALFDGLSRPSACRTNRRICVYISIRLGPDQGHQRPHEASWLARHCRRLSAIAIWPCALPLLPMVPLAPVTLCLLRHPNSAWPHWPPAAQHHAWGCM